MLSLIVVLLTGSCGDSIQRGAESALFTTTSTVPASPATSRYRSSVYGVSFDVAADWTATTGHSSDALSGPSGFVVLGAQQAPSLDRAIQFWTEHILRPYGSAPTISRINVAGQEAALVTPSSDVPLNAGKTQVLAVITLPQPITLNGTSFQFLDVTVDGSHLDDLLTTLHWS